ncbi:hypothetical protein ABVT39_011360 [Epinephelus coioides]
MAPLTSPHHCDSCIHKTQKIAELEQRISNLYWIRDEEARLDSVVAPGLGPPGNPADLDLTIPEFGPGSMDTADPNPTGLAPAERSASAPQLRADDPAATATSRPASSAAAHIFRRRTRGCLWGPSLNGRAAVQL